MAADRRGETLVWALLPRCVRKVRLASGVVSTMTTPAQDHGSALLTEGPTPTSLQGACERQRWLTRLWATGLAFWEARHKRVQQGEQHLRLAVKLP